IDLQNAQRVLFEDNVLENSWAGAQIGSIFSLTSTNNGGTAPWSQTADVTIRHNLLRNASAAVTIAGTTGGNPVSNPTTRIAVHDNLILGMAGQPGLRAPFEIVGLATDVTLVHNTVAESPSLAASLVLAASASRPPTR